MRGVGPRGKERGDTEQWEFPHVVLEEWEKQELIAGVVELVATALFNTHYYSFGGKLYHQKGGDP